MKKYIFDIILEGIDGEGISRYYRYTGDYNKILEIVEDDKLTEIENFSPKSYDLMEESFQPELEGVTVIQMDKKKPRESVKKLHETFENIFGE